MRISAISYMKAKFLPSNQPSLFITRFSLTTAETSSSAKTIFGQHLEISSFLHFGILISSQFCGPVYSICVNCKTTCCILLSVVWYQIQNLLSLVLRIICLNIVFYYVCVSNSTFFCIISILLQRKRKAFYDVKYGCI